MEAQAREFEKMVEQMVNEISTEDFVDDSVKMYLKEIGRYPLLTEAEEKEMAVRMKNGDKEAREKLITSNLRLVVSIAKPYCREGITRAIADKARSIRIPVHMLERVNKMTRITKALTQEFGREPSVEEIALEMGEETEHVYEYLQYAQIIKSLNEKVSEKEDSTLMDFVVDTHTEGPEEVVERVIMQEKTLEILEGMLTERETFVLRARYGIDDGVPRTLEEIGKELKVTCERIRQIEAKALCKVKSVAKRRGTWAFIV